jgi:photosystem II stability/assembly factor-like uncharacterized protein
MHPACDAIRPFRPILALLSLASLLVLLPSAVTGQTGWQPQTLPALEPGVTYQLNDVKAVTGTQAWIVGGLSTSEGTVLKTVDGSSWNLVFRKGANADVWQQFWPFTRMSVVDSNNAWAVGTFGLTAFTTNGGSAWAHESTPCSSGLGGPPIHIYGAKAVTATNMWAVGWLSDQLAGQVWHRPYSGDCAAWGFWPYRLEAQYGHATVLAIDAADASNAWAVGYPGILHTTNGGDSWAVESASAGGLLNDVAVVSPTVAWAVGDGGTIMKTSNGGATWAVQGAGVSVNLRKVAAVSASVAWVVGDNGTILKTLDGGATWRPQVSGVADANPQVNLVSVTAVDANTAWAVGDQQTLLRVTDGGSYYPLSAPKLNALSPAGVPAAGSTTSISVYGQDFRPGARVFFGDAPAASVTFSSPGVLTVTAPAHAAGLVDVRVVNPDGQSDTVPNAFAFGGTMPVVVGVYPSWGYLNTQIEVDVLGAGFTPDELATDPVPTVNVNGTPVAGAYAAYNDVHVVFSPSLLQTAGLATVTVTTGAGTSNAATFAVNYGSVPVDRPAAAPYDRTVAVQSLSGPMSVTFYGLTWSGWVKVGKIFERPYWLTDGTVPPGYTLLPAYYYEVATYTSMHYAAATFCIPYADADISAAGLDEARLRLVSYTEPDGGREWADITYSLDATANVICGTGTAISYLALAQGTVPGPAPLATAIAPAIAPPTGGATFTITGGLFRPGATVTFGGTAAANATAVNGMTITGTVPAHALGLVDVVVTNPDAQAATMTAGFEYVTAPTVTSVTPPRGRQSGYTSVTIAGTGFRPGLTVRFGGTLMGSYSLVDDQTITGNTPAHAAGVVDVVVTNADGQSGTLAAGYTYVPPPTVTGVSPSLGPVSGGTTVTITGTGFETGASAVIGCAAATEVAVVSATSITAVTPACPAGTVSVTVYNADGSSGTRSSAFTFGTRPRADSIRPNSGSTAGGTVVTISGVNFQDGATVTLGGLPATGVTVLGSTSIRATTPAHAAGAVSVVVTNPDAQAWTMTYAFGYVAPPAFTDDPPQAGTTAVKLVHLTELRTRIAQLRSAYGLAAVSWTDPSPAARVTPIKLAHLTEMRTALDEVYAAAGRTPPGYTTPSPAAGVTAVAAVHFAELRSAVLAIW